MEKEKLSPEMQALLDKDPIAFFRGLCELREHGEDAINMGLIPGNPVTKKVKDATRWAAQQVKNAVDAKDDWLDGVKNPSRNPIEAALAANDKRIDRLKQSIDSKKWEKNLAKVSPADIIEVATKLGSGVYSAGVEARTSKINKRVAELQPLVQDVSNTIQNMSDKTDADREKRLLSARKLMLEVGKKRAGA
jgi:hypothetical protein